MAGAGVLGCLLTLIIFKVVSDRKIRRLKNQRDAHDIEIEPTDNHSEVIINFLNRALLVERNDKGDLFISLPETLRLTYTEVDRLLQSNNILRSLNTPLLSTGTRRRNEAGGAEEGSHE